VHKTSLRLTTTFIRGEKLYCVTWPKLGSGRNRRHFKNRAEAKAFHDQKAVEQQNYGAAGMAFTERERAEYFDCAEKLGPFNVTLRDAVNFYLPHLQATNRSCTVAQLIDEILKAKAADGASKRYIADLRCRLKQFATTFGHKPVAEDHCGGC
jgi:hypothetical protein